MEKQELVKYLQSRLREAEANVHEMTRELERLQQALKNQELRITEAKKRAEHYRAVLEEELEGSGLSREATEEIAAASDVSPVPVRPTTDDSERFSTTTKTETEMEQEQGRLPRGIGAKVAEIVLQWLPLGVEVSLSDILNYVDTKLQRHIPPSTVRSVLMRENSIRQTRKGYYQRVL